MAVLLQPVLKHNETGTKRPSFYRQHSPRHFHEWILYLIKVSVKFVHSARWLHQMETFLELLDFCAIKNSLKFIPALVKKMAWHRSGAKPLSEPMMVSLPTHISISRPLWVESLIFKPISLIHILSTSCELLAGEGHGIPAIGNCFTTIFPLADSSPNTVN